MSKNIWMAYSIEKSFSSHMAKGDGIEKNGKNGKSFLYDLPYSYNILFSFCYVL
jgi:hypothetical protein